MWVRLKSIQRLEKQGKQVTYHPGDWVDVGKQTALLWMSRGDAEIPLFGKEQVSHDSGILVVGADEKELQVVAVQFESAKMKVPLFGGEVRLACDKTLLWNREALLRMELINVGFTFLDTWEIACPLWSYTELAGSLGDEEERKLTQATVRDLRVPVYDTRLMFVKKTETTDSLMKEWSVERAGGADDRLSFLRAFYRVKPLMLALPITWTQPQAYADER